MVPAQKPVQMLAERVNDPGERKRLTRMGIYLLLLLLIVLVILVILALVYADSPDPTKLFFNGNRTFSFAGGPLSMRLTSETPNYLWCDMFDNGTVFAEGSTLLELRPDSAVMFVADDGRQWTASGPVSVLTPDGAMAVSVMFPPGPRQLYNNTHLYFTQANLSFDRRGPFYNLVASSEPGSFMSYDDAFVAVDGGAPLYSFYHYVTLSHGTFFVNETDRSYPFSGRVFFTGTCELMTTGSMSTFIPINDTENLVPGSGLEILNTDGSLVIGGREYECYGADSLLITGARPDSVAVMLRLGKVQAVGQVSSLKFRGYEYATQPINNFFRDGYFTIATGSLTALLALFSRQLYAELRRK